MENPAHNCNQTLRFDRLDEIVTDIKDTLAKLTDLLHKQTRAEEQLKTLFKASEDQEKRMRVLETSSAASRWVERVAWLMAAAAVSYFMK